MQKRCDWCVGNSIYEVYHDREWGVPLHDDGQLFELFLLECMQAGLSWITILKKREAFREAFAGFNPEKIAIFDKKDVARLLQNPGIIRHPLKIEAAIHNARCFLEIQTQLGGFDPYIWQFTGGRPIQNAWTSLKQVPAKTAESDKMSKDLKKRGFKFVGSVTCYSFMQAAGMVNDHVKECFRYKELSKT